MDGNIYKDRYMNCYINRYTETKMRSEKKRKKKVKKEKKGQKREHLKRIIICLFMYKQINQQEKMRGKKKDGVGGGGAGQALAKI